MDVLKQPMISRVKLLIPPAYSPELLVSLGNRETFSTWPDLDAEQSTHFDIQALGVIIKQLGVVKFGFLSTSVFLLTVHADTCFNNANA